MLYRRFGFLQARVLLNKQDQLRELEKDLDRLDKLDSKKDPSVLKSREKDDAVNSRRKKLLSEIEEKFKEYGHFTLYQSYHLTLISTSSAPGCCPRPCGVQPTVRPRLLECEKLLRRRNAIM